MGGTHSIPLLKAAQEIWLQPQYLPGSRIQIQSDRSSSVQDQRGMSDDLVRANLEGSNLVSQNARDVNRPSSPATIKGGTSPISSETVSSSYLGGSALQKAFQLRQPLSLSM